MTYQAKLEQAREEAEMLCQVTHDPEEVKAIEDKLTELNAQWQEVRDAVLLPCQGVLSMINIRGFLGATLSKKIGCQDSPSLSFLYTPDPL